jgi:hypothetical protein
MSTEPRPASARPNIPSMPGSGAGVGSIASVVRIPKVKPCHVSGVGTTQVKVENVPMNWIVP